ncbi:hypothetical protein B0A55_09397 [Friedmanniomyces simplex]|uniref:Uncharacterized protein n=1 Tax=Friedmanniomyces simplex TaxID=329884 RepID=A0A4U0WQZ6_9PEZI|nr:hypothetical protein B0A55_09397 [Friedmanniomyces simplex]
MPKQADPRDHRKPCTLCQTPRDVLVRCQIDETGTWHFVCPASRWKRVSGGVVDGDGADEHKWYRYGGMWKNKHEAVSAKKPKAKKGRQVGSAGGEKVGVSSEGEVGESSEHDEMKSSRGDVVGM